MYKSIWNFMQKHNINYYWQAAIAKFRERQKKYRIRNFDLYAIGQSHLDACWLWTKLSTIRMAIITFQKAVEHFEMYPYFTLSLTSPQYYDWVKRFKPKLFEKVKEYVKQGRLEIVGGMWIEPDANLPNGESFVRQALYGQLFYLENFGKIASIEVLEDSFGYNPQLPQIFIKSGAKAFWTTKITWNEYSEFPFSNFIWRGIDGSEIFTHMFMFQLTVLLDLTRYQRTGRKVKEPGLVFDSSYKLEDFEDQMSSERIRSLGVFYGFGDGGRGPLKEEIDIITNAARSGHMKFATTEQFFDIVREECGDLIPIWDDELYLEYHRGCYTSIVNIKRLNRFGEVYLRNCELLLTIFSLFYKYFKYPASKMEKLWKDLLFNQFHDILPGSSIQDVYYEQEKELDNIIEKTQSYISVALQFILLTYLKKQDIMKNADDFLIVVNTLPWNRDEIIYTKDIKGNFPSLKNRDYIKIEKIPPISYKIINLKRYLKENEHQASTDLKLNNSEKEITLENSKLIITIKKTTGKITSLVLKEIKNRELIREANGIGIHVYKEKTVPHAAWEIYKNFTSYPVNIGMVKGIQIEMNTDLVKSIKIIYKFKKTAIYHYITLRSDSDKLEFKTDVDVHDKKLLFKVRFPFNLKTNLMSCEIPYGYKIRKIVPESEMEEGKWEFPALKYVDISDEDIGVTLLNNSKYGFSKNEKGVYLTLLHTPRRAHTPFFSYIDLVPKKERTKYLDIGFNSTEYALWFHKDNFTRSLAWRRGYEYNYPLLLKQYDKELPSLPEFFDIEVVDKFKHVFRKEISLVNVDNPNVILQVMKKPEKIILELEEPELENNNKETIIIIRLFETSGFPQENVDIEFDNLFRINKAIETDLLERKISTNQNNTLKIKDHRKLTVNFGKFEIKTIKLWLIL
jgi:alpha-mannosidase